MKETRTLTVDALRTACIENNWYTLGSVREYRELFELLLNKENKYKNATTKLLEHIATDIMIHSVLNDEIEVSDIMSELCRYTRSTFHEN